jgi:thiol-disulfide isomerase/thioredoxin
MLLQAVAAAGLFLMPVVAAAAGTHQPHEPGRADSDAGIARLGHPAPAWTFTRWIGAPQSLASLHGKAVLLRWWTEGCHYCAATLPGLEALRRAHADQGLVVIGVYHPKPPREVSDRSIVASARRLGFQGLLAVDRDWTTLERYWLDGGPDRSWTSVSFLIDRAGTIRWVHGGGEYHRSDDPAHARCAAQVADLERVLARVLAEPAPASVPAVP